MARNSLKNVARLIDVANNEVSIEKQFLMDLEHSIELEETKNVYIPSKTYKPSSMICERQMVYQVLGYEPEKDNTTASLTGICESRN